MLTAPAAIAVSLIFPVRGPASMGHFLLFLLSLIGSVFLMGALNFVIGSFAVRMKSILGLLRAKFFVQELLSGLLVPMTMFPPAAQTVLSYLPFQHIAYTPLRIYLGKAGRHGNRRSDGDSGPVGFGHHGLRSEVLDLHGQESHDSRGLSG